MKHYKLSQTKALPLILVFLFLLFPHSSLARSELEDVENYKDRGHGSLSYELQYMPYLQDEGEEEVERKELHEVHSGPNPISNSIPLQKRIRTTRPQRFP